MTEKRKVILFGVDGGTWRVIEPLVADGKLPHFAEFMHGGAYGVLYSTYPPYTLPAWTSIFTGVNPAKHGITDFTIRIGNEYKLCTAQYREVSTAWRILSDTGRKVILVNDPVAYPPEPIGIHVTGFLTPPSSKRYTYPEHLREELDKATGGYYPEVRQRYYKWLKTDRQKAYEALSEYSRKVAEAAMYLLRNYEWDASGVVFTSTDRLQHYFWSMNSYIEQHYREIDTYLSWVMDTASQENADVIIVSDHGFRGVKTLFYANTLLYEHGYIDTEKETIATKGLRKAGISRKTLLKLLKRHETTLSIIRKLLPKQLKKTIPTDGKRINTEKSKAFVLTDTGVFINYVVFESDEERNKVLEDVMQLLLESGFVKSCVKAEQVIYGPLLSRAPDIFMVLNDGVKTSTELHPGIISAPTPVGGINGDHEHEGIFLAHGPNVNRLGKLTNPLSVYDIAPTLLALLNAGVPDYCDGKPLTGIFKDLSYITLDFRSGALARERLRRSIHRVRNRALRG